MNIQRVSIKDGKAVAKACKINCIFFNFAITRKGRSTYKLFRNAKSYSSSKEIIYYKIVVKIIKKSSIFQLDFKKPITPNARKLSPNSIEKQIAKIISNVFNVF